MAEVMIDGVEFRAIPEYPGYLAGSDGSIWTTHYRRRLKQCVFPSKKRYLRVCMRVDGKTKTPSVHGLVLAAFSGPRPENHECRHLNGDWSDNRPENLAWGTRQENSDDKERHGTYPRGERNGMANLSEEQVIQIRERRSNGEKAASLAREFGTSRQYIQSIIHRRRWRHC